VRLVIEPGAAKDFDAAVNWYARVGRDLVAGFVAEMERRVAEVLAAPESYPFAPDQRDVRQAPATGRFPHAIVFVVRRDAVHVVAFAHPRRRPGYWGGPR
jgi:hypothetical protein